MIRRAAAIGALGLAFALPAAVAAGDTMPGAPTLPAAAPVTVAAGIGFAAFTPPDLQVLAGDTITWTNASVRKHTVTADDGSFGSPDLSGGGTYSRSFDSEGTVAFHCTIHPFMRGTVDVRDVLLLAPSEPAAPGRDFTVRGRSSLPAGTPVTVEEDAGTGFAPVAHVTVGDDGGFRAAFKPSTAGELRAVAQGHESPPVRLLVLDRHVQASARRTHGGGTVIRTQVLPASPGSTVVLQLHLRERFGWWPLRFARLDRNSRAVFRLGPHQRGRARVVLTLADGATKLAVSRVLRAGR